MCTNNFFYLQVFGDNIATLGYDKSLNIFDRRDLLHPTLKFDLESEANSVHYNFSGDKIALTYQENDFVSIFDVENRKIIWRPQNYSNLNPTLAWHPNQSGTFFTSASNQKSKNLYYESGISAIQFDNDLLESPVIATYSNYSDETNFSLKTFRHKPFMVVMNGLCQGSLSLIAQTDVNIF